MSAFSQSSGSRMRFRSFRPIEESTAWRFAQISWKLADMNRSSTTIQSRLLGPCYSAKERVAHTYIHFVPEHDDGAVKPSHDCRTIAPCT